MSTESAFPPLGLSAPEPGPFVPLTAAERGPYVPPFLNSGGPGGHATSASASTALAVAEIEGQAATGAPAPAGTPATLQLGPYVPLTAAERRPYVPPAGLSRGHGTYKAPSAPKVPVATEPAAAPKAPPPAPPTPPASAPPMERAASASQAMPRPGAFQMPAAPAAERAASASQAMPRPGAFQMPAAPAAERAASASQAMPRPGAFQMPAAPPSGPARGPAKAAASEPVLPGKGSYRGGLFDQLDVPAATSFLVCALLFVLAVVWVKSVDYSSLDRQTLDDVPERIARILMPLKPPGKPVPKTPANPKQGRAAPKEGPAASGADASAAARIERSRRTVSEKVAETQQRVNRVAMLSILSGKGPATRGATTASRARARGGDLVDFGGLEEKLANLEGLTKFDSKSTVNNGGATRDDGGGALAGIDKMVKGFQNAKVGTMSKIGVMELEKPELLERNSKYTGDRSMADVGLFISKKQNLVTMLYEERLKIDPTLEGKITVVLVIEEDGTVSSATVLRSETTLNDQDFQNELLRRIKRWIFPPSTGGPVEMKSPFVFKPA